MKAKIMRIFGFFSVLAVMGLSLISADAALANQPHEWQMGFQEAVTPIMHEVNGFHDFLLWIIGGVCVVVLVFLVIIVLRFNERKNPVPAKFSHNTTIEVIWTIVPIIILLVIAIPSFRLLFNQDVIPEADMTLKVTGSQWLWTYQYPDFFEDEEFIATMVPKEDLGTDPYGNPQPRLLTSSFEVMVPVGKTVRVVVTAADVLHSWAVPSFGVKIDAVPGRLNETWFKVEKEGMYYGQCSELCGKDHAFMPIAIHAVPQQEFDAWVRKTRGELGLAALPSDLAVAAAK